MERGTFKHIEQILRDYPYLDTYIANREQELMYPFSEDRDENIGGGRSNVPSKPVERMAITIADDRRLISLERNRQIVDDCLDNTDEDTKSIIYELYFKKHRELTISGVAQQLHLNDSTVSRKRTAFFEAIRDELGW